MRQKWFLYLAFCLVLFLAACGDSATPVPAASTTLAKPDATSTPVVLGAQPNNLTFIGSDSNILIPVTPQTPSNITTRPAAPQTPIPTTANLDPEQVADDNYNNGKFAQAETQYQELVNKDPNNAMLLLKLGATQLRLDKIDQGIANLEKSVKIDATNPNTLLLLAQAYADKGDMAKAIPLLEKAVQLQPDSAELSYYLGDAYFIDKQYDKAVTALQNTIKLQPDAEIAHGRLALTYFVLGKFPEAEAEFKVALQLDPKDGGALNNLAFLYIETGRFDDARDPISKAEKLGEAGQPYFEDTKLGLLIPDGQKEEAAGNLDKAAELYTKAAKASNTLGYYYLGKLEQGRQKLDAAADALKSYIKEGRMPDLKKDAEARLKQMGKA